MAQTINPTATRSGTDFYVPTREQVESLQVGDIAPGCFGPAEVTEIFASGYSIPEDGERAFVCYYTRHTATSTISASMKEGELVRTLATSNAYTSAELDSIERELRQEVAS